MLGLGLGGICVAMMASTYSDASIDNQEEESNYKELYMQIRAEKDDLINRIIESDSIPCLCSQLSKLVKKEIDLNNLFKRLGSQTEEQPWTKDIIKLGKVLNQYLNSLSNEKENKDQLIEGMVPPQALPVRFERYKTKEFSKRSRERHVANINKIMEFKCRNRDHWVEELRKLLVENWDMKDIYLPSFGVMDTDYLQMVVDTTDARWDMFTREFVRRGWNPFVSRRTTRDKRKVERLVTAQVFRNVLQQGKGGGAQRTDSALMRRDELMEYFICFIEEIEAICLCIDCDINANQFCIPDLISRGWKRTIVTQIAGDKQTNYGYSESHCSLTTMKAPMSGQRSIPVLLICGNFADERRSHEQIFKSIYDKFGYDKRTAQRGLGDFPVVLSLVLFHTSHRDNKLSSRLAKSAVAIWDYGMKEECDDIIGVEQTFSVAENVMKLNNSFVSNKYSGQLQKKKQKNSNNNNKIKKKDIVLWQEAQSYIYSI